jgi:signal transduction histidine kinase
VSVHDIRDIERLKKINAALISRVERSMDQQGNAFSLFQTAINLENRIKQRTEELNAAMRRLEQTNLDLVAAKEAAERANLSKTRFLAAASHDVLQPLNAAHLSISALADLPATTESTRLVRQIERSLETMDELLRTLLDISKLDAGVVKAELRDVPISQIFQSLRSDFQPIADQKQVRLRFRPSLASARTDRSLLRRMLQNIISLTLCATPRKAAFSFRCGGTPILTGSKSGIPAAASQKIEPKGSLKSSTGAWQCMTAACPVMDWVWDFRLSNAWATRSAIKSALGRALTAARSFVSTCLLGLCSPRSPKRPPP